MADNHTRKKRKLEPAKKHISVEKLQQSLQAQNLDGAVEVLNQFRDQITVRSDEGAIGPQDERLLFVQRWLESSSGAHDLFSLWEKANVPNLPVTIVSTLAALLRLLSSHYTYHALGHPIVKTLLSSQWIRRLGSYVGATHNELVLVTLKLFGAISAFAGGREKKNLLDVFQWEIKSLPKLLNRRRKGKEDYNPLLRPDIRTLYILFLISFLDAPTQIKNTFLEQHRDAFLAIFKGLPQDHYLFIRHVLETIWVNLWSDPKLKRTIKIGLFSEITISHLLKIYERKSPDNEDQEEIPADLVHHFLLAICTRPGTGICFRDRGWYPREDTGEERGGRIYNKILANILKTLKVNEDSRQQELARRILEACPELVAGYWPSAQLTLESRLSTKWIANISFFGTVISFPVPEHTFLLPNTTLYNPTPPPLQNILSNVLPSEISPKNIFTKGLLSSSGLVQHCTALTLAKCLMKYAKIRDVLRVIEGTLEVADAEEGQWGRRRSELEKEVRKRVPEFQVIVGFSQQQQQQKSVLVQIPAVDQTTKPSSQKPNPMKNAFLQESAQRLLLLYHQHLPEVVVEARFDIGKTLTGLGSLISGEGEGDTSSAAQKLQLVQQLHVLRTLKESDQFIWTNKLPSSRTYLYALLKTYITTNIPALQLTLLTLLSHLLSNSILFQEAPSEPRLWLISLPRLLRASNATSPDGVELTDESESVITFLDDCIQRCLKTPIRYIEEMQGLLAEDRKADGAIEVYPSPLLMTLGEQLDAKIKAGLLTPSDVLAIISFTRKLVFRLSGQVYDLFFLELFASWVNRILPVERLWAGKYPVMAAAVRREVNALFAIANPTESKTPRMSIEDLHDCLVEPKNLVDVGKTHNHVLDAHSIIDRLRFLRQPLSTSSAKRIILGVQTHHAPALQDLAQYLFPRSGHLWENHVFVGTDVGEVIAAEWLFYDATKEQISDSDYRKAFILTFISTRPTLQNCLELVRIIGHRLGAMDDLETRGLFSLLAVLMCEVQPYLKEADMITLKESLFARPSVVKRLAVARNTHDKVKSGLCELLQASFDPRLADDKRILSGISMQWLAFLQDCLLSGAYNKFGDAVIWIKYLPSREILRLFDRFTSDNNLTLGAQHALPPVQSILLVIQTLTEDEPDIKNALRERIPQLLALRKQLNGSQVIEELLSTAFDSALPVGHSAGVWGSAYENSSSFTKCIKRAESCWANRIHSLGRSIPLNDFLKSDTWTSSTVAIISGLLYKQGLPLHDFETWLKSEHAPSRSADHLAVVMMAALDIYHCASSVRLPLDTNAWIPHLSRISSLCFDDNVESASRRASCACLVLAFNVFKDSQHDLIQDLTKNVADRRNTRPTPESLQLFSTHSNPEISSVLLEWSLHWLIGQLTENTLISLEKARTLETIHALVQSSDTIKAPQIETLMGAVIQHHLSDATVVNLVIRCISKTNLKPGAVNRYLQSVLQHPLFHKLPKRVAQESNARSHIVELLHTLFNLHPTNTCQIAQIEPLLRIYHGTLSKEDLTLFSIFQLFEIQRKASLHPLFNHWSSSTDIACSSTLESIQSLDPIAVFQTTLHFPKWRKLLADPAGKSKEHNVHLYDPIFLLLLLHSVLSENRPSTPFGWIELFRTNVVGLCIRIMSSGEAALRELALSQIALLYQNVESVEFQEKAHVVYILNLLKDLFPLTGTDDPPPRLPSYTTLIVAHALRGVFYPSNFIYPLTARFLVQRPELDISDVPMLYSMLYSNSDDWRKERNWIIRYIANGMASSEDWRVLKRRHTWDLLASLFQSSETDNALRKVIFEVIANMTCSPPAVTSTILNSSFLPWLEMQISRANGDDSVKWARILGNTVITLDHRKMDYTLQSDWRTNICRCLFILFKRARSNVLLPAVHIIFKMSESSNAFIPELNPVVKLAVGALEEYEKLLDTKTVSASEKGDTFTRYDLYRNTTINDSLDTPLSYRIWLDCVILLWRTTMIFEHKTHSWDLLTCRLLASRYYNDTTRQEIEWVRKEVIRSLAS